MNQANYRSRNRGRKRPAPAPAPERDPQQFKTAEFHEGAFSLLMNRLQHAIAATGYSTPTPIQEKCIKPILDGRDLMGSAQTGTGKTAAFALPMLEILGNLRGRPEAGFPRALLLAPTRELAAQIDDSLRTYGRFLRISHTAIYGGVPQGPQERALRRGVDALVATPGRLLDLMEQGLIHLDDVGVFVLDEVDRMLDMGFMPDIKRLLQRLPEKRQTLFFSATLPPSIRKLAEEIVTDPVQVRIEPGKPAVDKIAQKILFVRKANKNALLLSLLEDNGMKKAIVFTQMKHVANRVVEKLESAGVRGVAIHGNKSQSARMKALNGFRQGRYRVLVATDVAARGIDVDDISHVINYDLPVEAETYVHRIGRTARAGAEGAALTFCTGEERPMLSDIERLLGRQIPVELSHPFHCEVSHSSAPAASARRHQPSQGGGGGRPMYRKGGSGARRGGRR